MKTTQKDFSLKGVTKLDLGDTFHGNGEPLQPGWISIALDETDKLIGDYTKTPFPDNSFEYAYGSCYLEFDETTNVKLEWNVPPQENKEFAQAILEQYTELYRILKLGGEADLSSCNSVEGNGMSEKEKEEVEHVNNLLQFYGRLAQQVGFITDLSTWKLVKEEYKFGDVKGYDWCVPTIKIRK